MSVLSCSSTALIYKASSNTEYGGGAAPSSVTTKLQGPLRGPLEGRPRAPLSNKSGHLAQPLQGSCSTAPLNGQPKTPNEKLARSPHQPAIALHGGT